MWLEAREEAPAGVIHLLPSYEPINTMDEEYDVR